jgi:hypothetical protein
VNLERTKHEIEDDASTALWLTKLRWIAIVGQLLVIGFVSILLKFPLYLPQLLALVLLTALSNLGLWFFAKRALSRIEQEDNSTKEFPQRGDLGGVLLFDVIILTGLLYSCATQPAPRGPFPPRGGLRIHSCCSMLRTSR